MMRRLFPLVVLMVLGVLAVLTDQGPEVVRTTRRSEKTETVSQVIATRRITHVGATPLIADLPAADPIAVATQILEAHRATWELRDYHSFEAEAYTNPLSTLVRFQVYQGKVPVLGMNIEIELDRDLKTKRVTPLYKAIEKLETTPTLAPQLVSRISTRYETSLESLVKASPVIYYNPDVGSAELAFVVRTVDKQLARPAQILVRAADGQILKKNYPRAN